MKLHPEFDLICGSLLNREVIPALDVVLPVVLREETTLGTQAVMESTALPSVALLARKSTTIASTRNTKRSVQCYCRRRPNHSRTTHQAYQKNITTSSGSFTAGHDLEKLIRDFIVAALPEAISSTLSASSSGTSNSTNSTWHLDSGASNHMTGDLSQFSSFCSGVSKHVIHTANGHTLPTSGISSIGNLSNVLYVSILKANLI
ncbi:hypothetical protein CQW23_13979 [Capsicum baccatum]|uniref:Retrovirus-related Pol polyprotein from transposon TNT 1-94-like beta-barrel domain-containing protein n=1 Tax=Capsicum baccatum TaxID=33114 RepID=A0A2G2WHW0_CAPBA|nr:hypothetical protein CQW23_13979 [Capsicum baccatum]